MVITQIGVIWPLRWVHEDRLDSSDIHRLVDLQLFALVLNFFDCSHIPRHCIVDKLSGDDLVCAKLLLLPSRFTV